MLCYSTYDMYDGLTILSYMGGVCTRGQSKNQALEVPTQRKQDEFQWISTGKQIVGENQ